ncbi:MAG: acyl carrier protein [Chloroflexota bacterium]|jgi:acyl carrier protein
MDEFIQFVADIFEVSVTELNANTAYGMVPQWDSLMQIRLIMEIESKYGVTIPIDEVSSLHTLADFYQYIKHGS